ncbi:MAG: virulence protein RhuM/Fic/DOC family protein [Patescibacteria group bacterium]
MKKEQKRGEIIIYNSDGDNGKVEVRVEGETLWLSQNQMADLFGVNQPAIAKHLSNVFKSGELEEKSVHSILEYTAKDGKKYKTKFYNLDGIISVGYRVNSREATQFRIWATRTLKDHLTKGYTLNKRILARYREKFLEARKTLAMIASKSDFELLQGHEKELIELISEYSKSFKVLEEFDERKIEIKKLNKEVKFEISYDGVLEIIGQMKNRLAKLRVNVYMFGTEVGHKLSSTIGSINQTFDGQDLYPSVEEKAANLLYLVIKDHPLTDGNKRVASMLFVYFLENNSYLYRTSGERKISDNTLIALALLVATSDPKEKDNIVRLIMNLIQN